MLVKFESKSNRVKGVSFHPKRPWVLASLHNGAVQLWDYRMGTLVDKFEEHDGPVRGVAFHPTQPLFVSGGDDYKLKVWNYKQRKCLFTLTGHLDYVRTVVFHHEYPWILSASDDQTIRIWNWQSRNCISILTGHNHYVMCAQFHPKEDLVVSASLDQTVRVWDISGLRKKNTTAPSTRFPDEAGRPGFQNQQADMFGNTDVLVKYVLEGHDRGVNWASFHPTLPLIVSGADDRQVKLWRMSETKAWEVDTCRGHFNNVSCVLFHPRQELILSNSEDKTIRVWDMSKRTGVHNFRRENDRFWVLTAHPEHNLFAAGHDNGLIVFKFERERPAFVVHQNSLFFVNDKSIKHFDFTTGNEVSVIGIRKATGLNMSPRTISYNPAENSVILTSPADGGIYEIYQLPKNYLSNVGEGPDMSNDCKRGTGHGAVFVARNRYAVLNRSTQVLEIKNLNNDSSKTISLTQNVTEVFYAGTGQVLLASQTSVYLYDVQEQQQLAELPAAGVKYVFWSSDMQTVALMGRHSLIMATKKLDQICHIHETIRLKGGVWDETGLFIYSTLNHIKYGLPNGDSGIIRTVDQPMYLVRCAGKNLYCLDRQGKCQVFTIDPTEFRFKQALVRKRYDEVLHIIQNSNLVGQSIIAYLTKKGYPEVALQFVREPKTRFDLALECGNMEIAEEMAKTMDQEDSWTQLAETALKQGSIEVVEKAYQRVKIFNKLSFLYAITGSFDKLRKMMKIAELRNDYMSKFHNALYAGEIEEQVKVLREVGMAPLAYSMAIKHGLSDEAASILEEAGINAEDIEPVPTEGNLLVPLTPIVPANESSWPLLPTSRGFFEEAARISTQQPAKVSAMPTESAAPSAEPTVSVFEDGEEAAADWGLDDDLDIDVPETEDLNGAIPAASTATAVDSGIPQPGPSFSEFWARNSPIVGDHIAAGSFESAMLLLNRQVGVVEFSKLKPLFLYLFQASRAVLPQFSALSQGDLVPIHRNPEAEMRNTLPARPINLNTLKTTMQQALQATTGGKFPAAVDLFTSVLHKALFCHVQTRDGEREVHQMIETAREYILGLKMELKRREITTSDPNSPETQKRAMELSAYFTHTKLQPIHLTLSLQLAMTQAYKLKCLQTCAVLVRRLLELGPSEQIAAKARKLQSVVENAVRDEVELNYNPLIPFAICATSFTPIYDQADIVECPHCGAKHHRHHAGEACGICGVGEIGKAAAGLKLLE